MKQVAIVCIHKFQLYKMALSDILTGIDGMIHENGGNYKK